MGQAETVSEAGVDGFEHVQEGRQIGAPDVATADDAQRAAHRSFGRSAPSSVTSSGSADHVEVHAPSTGRLCDQTQMLAEVDQSRW